MKRLAIFCAMALVPNAAIAAPVYLTCDFAEEGKPQPRKITLDEGRGTATIYYPETAESQTVRADFSDDMVLFETYVDRYGVNRISLFGVRQAKLDGKIEKVQCRITAPPKRAF